MNKRRILEVTFETFGRLCIYVTSMIFLTYYTNIPQSGKAIILIFTTIWSILPMLMFASELIILHKLNKKYLKEMEQDND